MTNDLSYEVWAVIGGLAIIVLLFLFLGEPLQKRSFVKDCSELHTVEECLEMWEMGNG